MNFLEIAKNRFSCREYSNKPVENEKITQIMEAARIAPSANNFQPWYFVVVSQDKELLEKTHETYHREWFNDAPVVIIAYADKQKAWTRKADQKNYSDIDISIAIDHITLSATSLGLSTCWICNFYVDKVQELINLPKYLEPIALIPVGYCKNKPDLNRFEQKRKPLDEIVKFL